VLFSATMYLVKLSASRGDICSRRARGMPPCREITLRQAFKRIDRGSGHIVMQRRKTVWMIGLARSSGC